MLSGEVRRGHEHAGYSLRQCVGCLLHAHEYEDPCSGPVSSRSHGTSADGSERPGASADR